MIVALCYVGLALTAACAVARIAIGPTLADRVIALDVALVSLMAAIAIDAANRGDTTWLNLLVVIAIVGFAATVAVTRYVERSARGSGS